MKIMAPRNLAARGHRSEKGKQVEKPPVKIEKPKPKSFPSKQKKISEFNPSDPALKENNLFGLPFTVEEADVVIVPVPWDVTVSYAAGAAAGPKSVLEASHQVDLFDPDFPDFWRAGAAMMELSADIVKKSEALRGKASKYLDILAEGKSEAKKKEVKETLDAVNKGSADLNKWVKETTEELIRDKKLVGILGGEHSVPLGFIQALGEEYDRFGVLQIDAHMDLRDSYEGFKYSHASIMRNVLDIKSVSKLVQVGIRDFCSEESEVVQGNRARIVSHTDASVRQRAFEGISWQGICEMIIKDLPKQVYISLDIDGLKPTYCPTTGTPVPGGLEFQEMMYLIKQLVASDREIIGFDLCEVAPGDSGDWDANVGARILFKLCGYMHKSMARMERSH